MSKALSPTHMLRCILLAIILIAGMWLRVNRINQQSLWIDELLSLEISDGHGFAERDLPYGKLMHPAPDPTSLATAARMWRIIPEQVVESHPPLYFLLLRAWRDMWNTDFGARMLSAIISMIGVVLIYDVGRLLSGTATGLWAAAIMAVAGSQIMQAQEARQYTLLLTLALASADVLLRIEKLGFTARRGALLGVWLVAMMWTHYFAIAPALAIFIYALSRLPGKQLRGTLTAFLIAAGIYAIAWGPVIVRQTHNLSENNGWLNESRKGHLQNTRDRLLMLPIRLLGEPFEDPRNPIANAGTILALALLIYPIELRKRRELLLPLLLFILPIALILGFDLARSTWHLYVLRYSIVAGGGLCLLLASPVIDRAYLRHVIPAVAVMYGLLSLPATYTPWKEDYRDVARRIEAQDKSAPIIFFSNTGDHWEGGMYLGVRHYMSGNHPMAILTTTADQSLLTQLQKFRDVWVICGWKYVDPQIVLPGATLIDSRRAEKIGVIYHMRFPQPATKPI